MGEKREWENPKSQQPLVCHVAIVIFPSWSFFDFLFSILVPRYTSPMDHTDEIFLYGIYTHDLFPKLLLVFIIYQPNFLCFEYDISVVKISTFYATFLCFIFIPQFDDPKLTREITNWDEWFMVENLYLYKILMSFELYLNQLDIRYF